MTHSKKARVEYPWNATPDTLELTGIPTHCILLSEIERLQDVICELKL